MAYTEAQARKQIIEAGHKLVTEKLVARTWGNISARISDTQFIITPSGRGYDTLQESDLVVVNIADCSYEGSIKPSSEKGIHAAAYQLRPDCNFVVHTHQFFASAVCSKREDTAFAPCAAYGLPGTKKLKKNVKKSIRKHKDSKAFLMANHGAVVLGDSFEEAFDLAKELEENSKAVFESTVTLAPQLEEKTAEQSTYKYSVINGSPIVATYLRNEKALPCYLDDFAQIVGVKGPYCQETNIKLGKANAVLVEQTGALCASNIQEDLDAISYIVEKNCASALYAKGKKSLGLLDRKLQRYIYLNKYSKLK